MSAFVPSQPVSVWKESLDLMSEILKNAGASPRTIENTIARLNEEKMKRHIVASTRAVHAPVLGKHYMAALGNPACN